MKFKDISIQKFKDELQNKSLVLDIRDIDSYNNSNIPNSKNYNSEDIMQLVNKENKSTNIVIYCYHGNSSRKVASFLVECGFKKVYSLIGGFSAWKDNKL